jgi:hypothetical protein
MIDLNSLPDIFSTYRKYGWIPRRILLNDDIDPDSISSLPGLSDVEISSSDISAAWFSRPAKDGPVAWEIRYLGDPPFALLESIDERSPDFEILLGEVEGRLREAVLKKSA